MSFCTFAEGAAMFDSTPIENMFLMEYMYDAPAPELRVYLYVRMLALHPELGGGIADAAKALRMDEAGVYDALTYWERRGLVRRVRDNPPGYELIPLHGQGATGVAAMDREMYANRDFNNSLQKLFGEKLIGDHELRKAADWRNILHFEPDAVVLLVEYGIRTSRSKDPKPPSVFRRMDEVAEAWSQRGIRTREEVERAIAEKTGAAGIAREVLKKLGMPRQPSDPELEHVRRWTGEWGYTREEILAACDETTNSRNPSFKYLDAILEKRRTGEQAVYPALAEALRELNPASAAPTPDELARYTALLDEGYAPEMIKLAAVQCRRMNQHRFEDVAWRLSVWRKEGVGTAEEADAYMKRMDRYARQLRALLRKAGRDRRPSFGELETYRAWTDSYPDALIGFAAECAQGAGGSMAYMDKLLQVWSQAGVTTVEAARAQHEAWRQSRAGRAAGEPGERPANPALDYAQREYAPEEDEGLFVNLEEYLKEEGDGA